MMNPCTSLCTWYLNICCDGKLPISWKITATANYQLDSCMLLNTCTPYWWHRIDMISTLSSLITPGLSLLSTITLVLVFIQRLGLESTREIYTKITLEWTKKTLAKTTHALFYVDEVMSQWMATRTRFSPDIVSISLSWRSGDICI